MVGRKNSLLQKTLVYFQWYPDGNLSTCSPNDPYCAVHHNTVAGIQLVLLVLVPVRSM